MSMSTTITESLDDGRTTFEESRDDSPRVRLQTTDPVCGMAVDPSAPEAVKLNRNGITYYFCSVQCKRRFEANPGEFIAAT